MRFSIQDTIAAMATPQGKGAISLIRVSGEGAMAIARRFFQTRSKKEIRAHRAQVGEFFSSRKQFIDQVVLVSYPKPKSYTGEDMLEISCHGSPVVAAEILETLISGGARLAEPGEFTFRAFLHGKMDLVQAEAIEQLIAAQTRRQVQLAAGQLRGRVSGCLKEIKERLIQILIELETAVEFVEDQLEKEPFEKRLCLLNDVCRGLERLSRSYGTGSTVCQGRKVAVMGRSNVGKSSLFNSLLNDERAIVCDLAGTTRDTLHSTMELEGVPVQIIDTAGWRKTKSRIEQEGLRRSGLAMESADLVLLVLDAQKGWTQGDRTILNRTEGKKVLLVWNKMDLVESETMPDCPATRDMPVCHVSALTGMGIEECRKEIGRLLLPDPVAEEEPMISNLRHKQKMDASLQYMVQAREAMRSGFSEEYVLADMKKALECLDEITGETTSEELLGKIFSRFCIGK